MFLFASFQLLQRQSSKRKWQKCALSLRLLPYVAGSSISSVDGDVIGQMVKPHQCSGTDQDVKVWLVSVPENRAVESCISTDLALFILQFCISFSVHLFDVYMIDVLKLSVT